MVVVRKNNNNIKICLDAQELNKAIQSGHFHNQEIVYKILHLNTFQY